MPETVPPEVVVDSPEHLAETLAWRLEEDASQAIAARGRFSLALPGGSVASAFFPRLARAGVDWARTDFFWVDERAVPPEDPESNYGAAERLWLTPAGVPPARVHRMAAAAVNLEAAAAAYEYEMIRFLGRPPSLDVALLGMGPDGHVCSLFPGHPLLLEERRLVAAVHDSPKPPARRLTLTLPALASAGRVVVAAPGEAKAAPAREALRDPGSTLPVAVVLRSARRVLLLLDHGAARLL